MAEPPATTRAAAVTAERDVLLATKLHVPLARPSFVVRPRLADRLIEPHQAQLTLVCAPAGLQPPSTTNPPSSVSRRGVSAACGFARALPVPPGTRAQGRHPATASRLCPAKAQADNAIPSQPA